MTTEAKRLALILLLEEELGEPLFLRVGRKVRMTAAAESLVQLGQRVFQDVNEACTAAHEAFLQLQEQGVETRRKIVRIVKVCNEFDVPFLARGAGTILAGGCVRVGGGVMIGLARMKRSPSP